MKRFTLVIGAVGLTFATVFPAYAADAVDAAAAEALIKKNNCGKCHSVDKEKKGPSFTKISAKYKGKADGEQKVILNITTSPKVKLDDGTEEEHPVVKTKDEVQMKNLAQWILSH
jgi:cytochrome c